MSQGSNLKRGPLALGRRVSLVVFLGGLCFLFVCLFGFVLLLFFFGGGGWKESLKVPVLFHVRSGGKETFLNVTQWCRKASASVIPLYCSRQDSAKQETPL